MDILRQLESERDYTGDYRPQQAAEPECDEEIADPLEDKDYKQAKTEPDEALADRFWTKYLDKHKKDDKEQTEIWKSDADGILIFTGLFSATVAAFIVESYKRLEPDSGDTTNTLLSQLVAIVNGTHPPALPPTPFSAPRTILDVNIFWFFSLILSLTCALGATLVQQWTRNYSQAVFDEHTPPRERGRLRAFLSAGVKRFRLPAVTNALPLLLHTSVFLFFSGLVEFLWQINQSVALAALILVGIVALLYATITHLPLFLFDCPYRTPLTSIMWPFIHAVTKACKRARDLFSFSSSDPFRRRFHDFGHEVQESYAYKTLDEYLKYHRSTDRAFGASDVDALAEVAPDISPYFIPIRQCEDFAMELPAVVTCASFSRKGALDVFSESHANLGAILGVLQSLFLNLEYSIYSGGGVSLDQSYRATIAMKCLSFLTLREDMGSPHGFHPSLPSEARCAVPHIINFTSPVFELKTSSVESLLRHQKSFTRCSARGIFVLAVVARLQHSLSQEHSDVESYDRENIPHILRAIFPHEHIPEDLMADDEGILANGACVAALCLLSDLNATVDHFGWYVISDAMHSHTMALLSTLSPYVGNTAPGVRQGFVRKWEDLDAQLAKPPDDGPWELEDWEIKRNSVELLRPLHDALKASLPVVVVADDTEDYLMAETWQDIDEATQSPMGRIELQDWPDFEVDVYGRVAGRDGRAEEEWEEIEDEEQHAVADETGGHPMAQTGDGDEGPGAEVGGQDERVLREERARKIN